MRERGKADVHPFAVGRQLRAILLHLRERNTTTGITPSSTSRPCGAFVGLINRDCELRSSTDGHGSFVLTWLRSTRRGAQLQKAPMWVKRRSSRKPQPGNLRHGKGKALMTYPFAAHEMGGSANVASQPDSEYRENCWRAQRVAGMSGYRTLTFTVRYPWDGSTSIWHRKSSLVALMRRFVSSTKPLPDVHIQAPSESDPTVSCAIDRCSPACNSRSPAQHAD